MPKKCKDCYWGVIGTYSRLYGGCPIGCSYKGKSKGFCSYKKKESGERKK